MVFCRQVSGSSRPNPAKASFAGNYRQKKLPTGFRQFPTVGQLGVAHGVLDLEWPNEMGCKLSTQSALQPKVFDGKEHQVPRLELGGWVLTLIRMCFIRS